MAAAPRAPDLTDTLCTRCGLCCDGTLLGDVELAGPAEAARMAAFGLDVDGDDADVELLSLPCAALVGTRCRIYAHRPRCCRTFECRLLQRARRGQVSVAAALASIADTKAQVRSVTDQLTRVPADDGRLPLAERCADAVARLSGRAGGTARARALEAALATLTRTIRATFLD